MDFRALGELIAKDRTGQLTDKERTRLIELKRELMRLMSVHHLNRCFRLPERF